MCILRITLKENRETQQRTTKIQMRQLAKEVG